MVKSLGIEMESLTKILVTWMSLTSVSVIDPQPRASMESEVSVKSEFLIC